MANYNKVILIGNLTRTPELRFTKGGKAWVKFSVAVSQKYKSGEGADVERVDYFDVSGFGGQAETVAQFLDKGSPILVEGRLTQDKWEDKEGKTQTKVSVTMRRFSFLPGKRRGDEEETPAAAAA